MGVAVPIIVMHYLLYMYINAHCEYVIHTVKT